MQFEFRIGNAESVTIDLQLAPPGSDSAVLGPEVVAASVSDSKLSKLSKDDVFSIAAQVVDYFSRPETTSNPGDWYDEWYAATRS